MTFSLMICCENKPALLIASKPFPEKGHRLDPAGALGLWIGLWLNCEIP